MLKIVSIIILIEIINIVINHLLVKKSFNDHISMYQIFCKKQNQTIHSAISIVFLRLPNQFRIMHDKQLALILSTLLH